MVDVMNMAVVVMDTVTKDSAAMEAVMEQVMEAKEDMVDTIAVMEAMEAMVGMVVTTEVKFYFEIISNTFKSVFLFSGHNRGY